MGAELVRRKAMSFVANVAKDPNFRNHPLRKAAPFARCLAHIPVQGRHLDIEAAITIINPELKWPFTAAVSSILTDLAMLVGEILKMSDNLAVPAKPTSTSVRHEAGMQEAHSEMPLPVGGKDTAGQFLLSTLSRRTSIRNRNDVSYVTLRTWSKPIKEHQLSALKIVKLDPDQKFINDVADEMAEHIRKLFGMPRIGCVVPVPCGHSRRDDCLSVKITRSLAEKLQVPFVDALQHTPRKGSSHPAKNEAVKIPKLVSDTTHESVLLVDDVATSGRHIELAVQSLRNMAQHVTAMAWIGST